MRRTVDLHIHTTASDGSYTPEGVVSLAKKCGLSAVAITDHDTTDGVDEALEASKKYGIEVVPGVEISVGETDSMHIIGLYANHKDKALQEKLDVLKESRRKRNIDMIDKLRQAGFDITYNEVARYAGDSNIGRLHIAQYIQSRGMVSDYRKVFKQYIIDSGSAYVQREKFGEREGIETILNAGGIPILAHINYFRKSSSEIEKIVSRLKSQGLMGIEVYYSGYNYEVQKLAFYLADKYKLLKSGGTDFHGARRIGVSIGRGRGNIHVPYSFLDKIKAAAGRD